MKFSSLIDGLLAVIYPRCCPVCGRVMVKGEISMCLDCRLNLPVTGYHLKPDFNELHERTMCHAPVSRATAMFHYDRLSPYAALVRRVKYNGHPAEGRCLAAEYAAEILPSGFFDEIDCIQPVPLSFSRLVSRGYNQSHAVAVGISDVTGIAVTNLLKARNHSSQTRRNAAERLANAKGIYSVKTPNLLPKPRHILLVDDIITTGATMIACAEALHKAYPEAAISLFAIAATRLN